MYFEIFRKGKLIKRGTQFFGDLEWDNELMYTPDLTMEFPIEYLDFFSTREEIKVHVNDKIFWGILTSVKVDKEDETITCTFDHIVSEWTFRQISVNNAVKDKKVNIVFKGSEVASDGENNVTASDFQLLTEEVDTFSAAQYIQRAGASGWTTDGDALTVTVDSSAVQNTKGDYNVKFKAGTATVTVKATVIEVENKTEKDSYTLTASNFSIYASELPLTDAQWISKAKATISPSLPLDVDASNVKATLGNYSVKFSATYQKDGEDTEITVSATVIVVGDSSADASIADNLADIYADKNFAYPGWKLNYEGNAGDYNIDYVYSRQNKLDALTKTMELTDDLFWRVDFSGRKVIDISRFGKKSPYVISAKPSGKHNIRMISEPQIEYDFSEVINLATVYSEKSDTGMSSMTLREVYNDPSLQKSGFPVVILRTNVNNERNYKRYTTQYPKLAPNNELEYAVIDEESVALEGGVVIEGTYAFNDLSPFAPETDEDGKTKEVTDADRIEAAKTAYHAVIKKLKQARRSHKIIVETEEIPSDLNVGDRVLLRYNNNLFVLDGCSNYMKRIMTKDDWYYVTKISYNVDDNLIETNELTLEKYIKIDRETNNS